MAGLSKETNEEPVRLIAVGYSHQVAQRLAQSPGGGWDGWCKRRDYKCGYRPHVCGSIHTDEKASKHFPWGMMPPALPSEVIKKNLAGSLNWPPGLMFDTLCDLSLSFVCLFVCSV